MRKILRLNRFFYTLLLYLLSPVIWGYFFFRALKAPEYRGGFLQRLGFIIKTCILPAKNAVAGNFQAGNKESTVPIPRLLVHCASVGETRAAVPLIKALIEAYPKHEIIISTTTPTGKKTVNDLLGEAVKQVYLPVDWPGSCQRFLKHIAPQAFIIMETELWPNLLHRCCQQNIPVLLANARLSDKSYLKYTKYPKLTAQILNSIQFIAAQYPQDKANFSRLGVAEDKITLVGNIKFDIELDEKIKKQQNHLIQTWKKNRPIWMAASIHPDEFKLILQTHQKLLKSFPDMLLIAVPRHPEKFDDLAKECQMSELNYVKRSHWVEQNITPNENHSVLVGDTMGEVLLFCGVADCVFVGGSLIERGGHNPLEPVVCGKPVIMGPYFYNFNEVGERLIEQQLLQVVENSHQLQQQVTNWLSSPEALEKNRQQAKVFMQQNQGCTNKIVTSLKSLLS